MVQDRQACHVEPSLRWCGRLGSTPDEGRLQRALTSMETSQALWMSHAAEPSCLLQAAAYVAGAGICSVSRWSPLLAALHLLQQLPADWAQACHHLGPHTAGHTACCKHLAHRAEICAVSGSWLLAEDAAAVSQLGPNHTFITRGPCCIVPFKPLLSRMRSGYSSLLEHSTGHVAAQQPEGWLGPRQRLPHHPCQRR